MVKMEKTKQVLDALKNKYGDWSYAFLTQVGNATGSCNRLADAIAISLWESRGLEIIGFEIKVSRQDWLKELKHPGKADPIAKYCDSWYLVLGDVDILRVGELPMGWGLMVPHTKNTLKITVPSKRDLKPKTLDKHFLSAILRRVNEQLLPEVQLQKEYERGCNDTNRYEKKNITANLEWKQKQIDRLEKQMDDFEKASGFRITEQWKEPKEVGEAVKVILNGTYIKELQRLGRLKEGVEDCAKSIGEEIQKIKELKI